MPPADNPAGARSPTLAHGSPTTHPADLVHPAFHTHGMHATSHADAGGIMRRTTSGARQRITLEYNANKGQRRRDPAAMIRYSPVKEDRHIEPCLNERFGFDHHGRPSIGSSCDLKDLNQRVLSDTNDQVRNGTTTERHDDRHQRDNAHDRAVFTTDENGHRAPWAGAAASLCRCCPLTNPDSYGDRNTLKNPEALVGRTTRDKRCPRQYEDGPLEVQVGLELVTNAAGVDPGQANPFVCVTERVDDHDGLG